MPNPNLKKYVITVSESGSSPFKTWIYTLDQLQKYYESSSRVYTFNFDFTDLGLNKFTNGAEYSVAVIGRSVVAGKQVDSPPVHL